MRLDGETRVIMIVGDPIGQVKSPALLTARLHEAGHNAIVVPAHVIPEELDDYIRGLRHMRNLLGVIYTIPHKFAALAHCDSLTDRVRAIGSANVLRLRNGRWEGDNCDGQGYVRGIERAGGSIAGNSALVVGAGGAGSAIAYEFLSVGALRVAIHDVDTARRDALIARLKPIFGERVGQGSNDPDGYDIIANATPLGMRPGDPTPVLLEKLRQGQFVADAITRPAISPMISHAQGLGCATMPGLGMFDGVAERMSEFYSEVMSVPVEVEL